ncbi:hypothetical protein KEM55_004562, partial [Ascosphaera atra]
MQRLRMPTHSPAGKADNDSRNQIPLRLAIPLAAKEQAQQASSPPDDTHRRMLEIVLDPFRAPPVLSEGVEASPEGNDQRVEELLTAARAAQPELADEEDDRKQDP